MLGFKFHSDISAGAESLTSSVVFFKLL